MHAFSNRIRVAHAVNDDRVPLWIAVAMLGGSLANLIDRAAFGAVHDFIAIGGVVFNLADVAVFGGVADLIAHGSVSTGPLTRS